VAEVTEGLEATAATICNWWNQHLVDTGRKPGTSSEDSTELATAKQRIAELEAELAATQRGYDLLRAVVPPKRQFETAEVMAAEGHPVTVSTRACCVSESGFYAWRRRSPSKRAIRHACLTDLILMVHYDSRGIYGGCRVHTELTIGRGIPVGYEAVCLLIRRAGIQGLPDNRSRRCKAPSAPTAADLVDRNFARSDLDQL